MISPDCVCEVSVPSYDYRCLTCGTPFTVRMSMSAYSAGAAPPCPACESNSVERTYATVNVLTAARGGSSIASCGPVGSGFS
jgi:putative FmdB family regulatory protein